MSAAKRVGSESSKTRAAILDAAEALLIEEGYASVTSRTVAARAGVYAGNLHYYFPTLDDMFVAILRRGADQGMERLATALASPKPLRALWQLSSDRGNVTLLNELMAAANHRKVLRDQVAAMARTANRVQTAALREILPQYGLDPEEYPAEALAAAIEGTALLVVREHALGLHEEHDRATAAIEGLIDRLERRRDLNNRSA
jgi:AcrR family transcriptional regulator